MKILWERFIAWLQVFLWVDDPTDDPNEYHTMDKEKYLVLSDQLDEVKQKRNTLPPGDARSSLTVEMGRLTAAMRKMQQAERAVCPTCGKVK